MDFFWRFKKKLRKTAVKVRVFWQLVFEWLEIVLSSRSSSKTFQENYDSVTQGKSDVRGPRLPKELSGTARRLLPCSFSRFLIINPFLIYTPIFWQIFCPPSPYIRACALRLNFERGVHFRDLSRLIQFQSTLDRTSSNVAYWQYKVVKHVVCDIMVKLMVGLCGRRVILTAQS